MKWKDIMTLEDLEPCARCGAQAEVHLYPPDVGTKIQYVVDCVNQLCARPLFTEPKYDTEEEAVAGWNEKQRIEKA